MTIAFNVTPSQPVQQLYSIQPEKHSYDKNAGNVDAEAEFEEKTSKVMKDSLSSLNANGYFSEASTDNTQDTPSNSKDKAAFDSYCIEQVNKTVANAKKTAAKAASRSEDSKAEDAEDEGVE